MESANLAAILKQLADQQQILLKVVDAMQTQAKSPKANIFQTALQRIEKFGRLHQVFDLCLKRLKCLNSSIADESLDGKIQLFVSMLEFGPYRF